MNSFTISGDSLDIETVDHIASNPGVNVSLSAGARKAVAENRKAVERLVESGHPLYGINTGFGDLATVSIPKKSLALLQSNLIRSHAVGVGEPLRPDLVRATLLLRANTLSKGASGVRPLLIDSLLDLLNKNVIPVIPEKGSLGASGDLAPLAHMSLVLMGEGEAFFNERRMPGSNALRAAGLKAVKLQAKEGLALINGTPVMSALACLSLIKAGRLLKSASVIAAMSIEALRGTDQAFDERIHLLRPHKGQLEIARHLRTVLAGSEIRSSHIDCEKVQDGYSLRCTPQVLGAALDAWNHTRTVIETEINSVTDNPLIFDDEVLSGGNFHGEPVGLVMDYLGMALAEVGSISERRTFRMLTGSLSRLPAFLVERPGLNSGLMIAQYTAASLVSENKILAHPATVDSIPSSADQEDHVSMATTAARKTFTIQENLADILAIELLCAAQAFDLLKPLKPAKATAAVHALLREKVPAIENDRCFAPDIEAARRLILSGQVDETCSEPIAFDWNWY